MQEIWDQIAEEQGLELEQLRREHVIEGWVAAVDCVVGAAIGVVFMWGFVVFMFSLQW